MAQIFHTSSNSLAKISIAGAVLTVGFIVWAAYSLNAGSFTTGLVSHRRSRFPLVISTTWPTMASIADIATPRLKPPLSPDFRLRKPA